MHLIFINRSYTDRSRDERQAPPVKKRAPRSPEVSGPGNSPAVSPPYLRRGRFPLGADGVVLRLRVRGCPEKPFAERCVRQHAPCEGTPQDHPVKILYTSSHHPADILVAPSSRTARAADCAVREHIEPETYGVHGPCLGAGSRSQNALRKKCPQTVGDTFGVA
jgi:hypothetical protein